MTKDDSTARLMRPHTYAADRLGLKLHPKHEAVLKDLFPLKGEPRRRLSVRKANEVGGTRSIVASAILFAIEMLGAQVISTAGKWLQVQEQLIPALKRFQHLYPSWQFLDSAIKVKGIDRYVGFSTTSGFAQGFHKTEEAPLLAIIDEAGLVEPGIFDDIEDRCNPDYFLAIGAPMDPVGRFYDQETKLTKFYSHHHISQMDCLTTAGWWLDPADVERKIAKHGRDNPFILSNVFGEFGLIVQNALLSLSEFEACIANPPVWMPGHNDRHAWIDFAAGRNKNVFACRVGNRVWIEKKWTDKNTMATVGECRVIFEKLHREYGFEPEEIEGDADGLGLPIVQRLVETGLRIGEYHGNSPALYEPQKYANRISEAWGTGTYRIKSRDVIVPDDADFKSQCLTRTIKRGSDSKFRLESKEDLAKRGIESPDEADAILNAIMPAPILKPFNMIPNNDQNDDRGWLQRAREEQGVADLPGAYV